MLVERETGWTSLRPTPAPRGHVLLLEPRDQLDLEPGSHAVVFVHNGWLCRSRVLPHGARQIIELLLTGDHHVSRPETAGDTLSALSRCEVSRVPASELQRAMDASETLRKVIVDAERRRSTILEERLVSLGQRSALQRLAHLLCELVARAAGGADDDAECRIPLTQADFADVLGLSAVHINRTLQDLKGRGLIVLLRGRLKILDRSGLAALAQFSPDYLQPSASENSCRVSI